MWFHAIQLSTTFIPSRKFRYLLQCSAVDIQTHSFTIQTVPASLPFVGQYNPTGQKKKSNGVIQSVEGMKVVESFTA